MINKITDHELKNIVWYMNFYLVQKLKNKELGKLLIHELVFRLLKDKKQRENIELIADKYNIGASSLFKFNQHLKALLYERYLIN